MSNNQTVSIRYIVNSLDEAIAFTKNFLALNWSCIQGTRCCFRILREI